MAVGWRQEDQFKTFGVEHGVGTEVGAGGEVGERSMALVALAEGLDMGVNTHVSRLRTWYMVAPLTNHARKFEEGGLSLQGVE